MLVLFKIPLIVLTVVSFFVCSLFVELFVDVPATKRHLHAYHTHLCSRVLLLILGVRIKMEDRELPLDLDRVGSLIVANHLSYLDVFILSSIKPLVFVTSKEVEKSGFLGLISKSAGAVFVERRSRSQITEELDVLSQVLEEGDNVVIFPEGTTSCGESVLPFKSTFFDAAVRARSNVLPVCINYEKINAQVMASEWKEHLFYYGRMEFTPHFLKLLELKTIEVCLKVGSPIYAGNRISRKELSQLSYAKIVSHYRPVV